MDYLPVAHIRATQTVLYITSADWTEVKVETDRLLSRKWVEVFNRSAYKLFYSYDNTTNVQGCFSIKAGGKFIAPLSESVPIYIRGSHVTGQQKVIVAEVA